MEESRSDSEGVIILDRQVKKSLNNAITPGQDGDQESGMIGGYLENSILAEGGQGKSPEKGGDVMCLGKTRETAQKMRSSSG